MTSFQDKIDFLKQNGWIERSPMSFVKNGYEMFWDNSHAVEVYPENDNKKRLFDIRIETIDELQKLMEELKKINEVLKIRINVESNK
jgi:uncharacterized protein YdeI (YjbR/CyaY-like superfamily)